MKSFGALQIKNAELGLVEAIVATIGVVDFDGDVLLRGCIPPGSKVKISSYNHSAVLDGAPPVGKGTISEVGNKAVLHGRFLPRPGRVKMRST